TKFLSAVRISAIVAGAFVASSLSPVANATVLSTWTLGNKNVGAVAPPNYGLRIDNLFGATDGSGNIGGNWTFDFEEQAGTGVTMQTIDNAGTLEIHISGRIFGGQDTGSGYAANSTGFWDLDFIYTAGVTSAANGAAPLLVEKTVAKGGLGSGSITFVGNGNGVINDIVGSLANETTIAAANGDLTIDLSANSGTKDFSFCYGSFSPDPNPQGCGTTTMPNGESRLVGSLRLAV
ncbi:MAG: hypothetical protein ACKVGZ_17460, partial [Alphaproteobacteria bacterium]